jgi:hypothetical protein
MARQQLLCDPFHVHLGLLGLRFIFLLRSQVRKMIKQATSKSTDRVTTTFNQPDCLKIAEK